jgi:DNA repair exonuclease SbcCD ATPase subunit
MITIKQLKWDNWFSYGEGNSLDFTDAKVTQITGKNGSGKSSIPVILGEVLTSKNAFGKTKQKLFNRYIDKPAIYAELVLDKDGVEYIIKYVRKATLKLTLLENGVDISSHSSTDTLKTINNLLGFDFKLLWELIYQSSTQGIAFLTATDTNRKKFLINLFSLDKYLTIHEQFKVISRDIGNELIMLSGKLSTINSFIEKNEKEDLTLREVQDVPQVSKDDIEKLSNFKAQLFNLADTNKKINDNNMYKSLLKELDTAILNEEIGSIDNTGLPEQAVFLRNTIAEYNTKAKILTTEINKINSLSNECPTCTQAVVEEFKNLYISERDAKLQELKSNITDLNEDLKHILELQATNNKNILKRAEKDKVSKELQDLLSKINNDIPSEVLDQKDIRDEITSLETHIKNINDSISLITSINMQAEAHNSKVKVVKEQLIDYKAQKSLIDIQAKSKEHIVNKINLIKKAFSTNGLPGYKIEFLAKDLEHQINTYLEELSNGRFQLLFALNGEKLDIDIIDDGKTIGIEELSAGELARINTSTLLAIRKLMSAISSTKINILFLDEIMGVLDDEGKEKLIDILNAETELNTFLVSHEFTHPLIPTINVVKENKISRIE